MIIDHLEDPAWDVIHEIVERKGRLNVEIEELRDRDENRTLFMGGLVQGVEGVDESVEVIAITSADVLLQPSWLREMSAPFRDKQVGMSMGYRWRMPDVPSMAALIRYVWNAQAMIQMFASQWAWGSCMAIRASVFRDSDLLEKWKRSFADDDIANTVVNELGYRKVFIPSLVMVARDTCGFGEVYRWIRRLLLTTRLYNANWLAIVVHCAVTTSVLVTANGIVLASLLTQYWTPAMWSAGGLFVYLACAAISTAIAEIAVRQVLQQQEESTNWTSLGTLARILVSLPLTQAVYAMALVSTYFIRRVHWRGIEYLVDGPYRIKMVQYQPYQARATEQRSSSVF